MIKEGVVKSDKTPCPVAGKVCNCSHPENECELTKGKVASASSLGAMLCSEDNNE
jgi:hypothetical protein